MHAYLKKPFFGGGRVVARGGRPAAGGSIGQDRRWVHANPYSSQRGRAFGSDRHSARACRRVAQRTVRGIRGRGVMFSPASSIAPALSCGSEAG